MKKLPDSIRRTYEIYQERTGKKIKFPDEILIDSHGNIIAKTINPKKKNSALEKKVANAYKSEIQQMVYSFLNYLQQTGGVIAPEQEIKLGKVKTLKLSDNGIIKYEYSAKQFNKRLTLGTLNLFVNGKLLYLGPPGCGKTSDIAAYARFGFGTSLDTFRKSMVTCNAQHTFSDVFAYPDLGDLMGKHVENFKPRPVLSAYVKCFDEVEKTNDDMRNALLSWLQDGFISHRGLRCYPPEGPFYFTANDLSYGAFPLSKAFLDRIDVIVNASSFSPFNIDFVNRREDYANIINGIPRLNPKDDLSRIRSEISKVELDDEATSRIAYFLAGLKYCMYGGRKAEAKIKDNLPANKRPSAICSENNCKFLADSYICNMTKEPVSVRTYQAVYKFTKAFAWLRGQQKATVDDLKAMLPYTLGHKLNPTAHALDKDPIYGTDSTAFIEDLFDKSGESYGKTLSKYPMLADVCRIITHAYSKGKNSGITQKYLNTMISDLNKIDSPIVYGLAVELNQLKRIVK